MTKSEVMAINSSKLEKAKSKIVLALSSLIDDKCKKEIMSSHDKDSFSKSSRMALLSLFRSNLICEHNYSKFFSMTIVR